MRIHWGFMDRDMNVISLGHPKVAYSWTCDHTDESQHTISCLWIWHDCDMNLDVERVKLAKQTDEAFGWKPTGVGLHDFISSSPLHIEPSLLWSYCCGMHGFIRDGKWVSV